MFVVRGEFYAVRPNHMETRRPFLRMGQSTRIADISGNAGGFVPTAVAYHAHSYVGNLHTSIVDGSSRF
jgi:hypothetical protein